MSTWHVWGDYIHAAPDIIGNARRASGDSVPARHSAEESGFDFDYRTRNGFEPWAYAFTAQTDTGLEFAFQSHPMVRGWRRI